MDTKIVIKGINAFGYKFELPCKLPEYLYKFNLNNYKRARTFVASVDLMNGDGEVVTKNINFLSYASSLPLKGEVIYWQEIQFEDGSVLQNENAKDIEETTHINKLNYENTHKTKFDDELNQYVGHPVLCHKKDTDSFSQCGVLLSVNPSKKASIVCADFGFGTYYMNLNSNSLLTVYQNNGEKLEELKTISGKEVEESQLGNE